MRKWVVVSAALAAGLGFGGAALAQDEPHFEFSAGVQYSSGDYGAVDDTTVTSAPLVVRYSSPNWRIDLTAPYIWLKGPGNVISGGVIIPGAGPVTSVDGWGDLVLGAGLTLPRGDSGPFIELGGAVKFATANSSIGTGEMDYAAQVAFRQPLGMRTSLTGGVAYEWLGDPVGLDLQDGAAASLGLRYDASDTTTWGGAVNWREAYLSGRDAPASISAYLKHKASEHAVVSGFVAAGLSDASPDYAVGVQLQQGF